MSQASVFYLIKPLFGYECHISLTEKICQCYLSGQIIATSHDLTPRGSRGRESPLILGKSRLVNKMIWPDLWRGERSGMIGVFRSIGSSLGPPFSWLRFCQWYKLFRNPKISRQKIWHKQQKSWVKKDPWLKVTPTNMKGKEFRIAMRLPKGKPSMVHIEKFWSMLPLNHANMQTGVLYIAANTTIAAASLKNETVHIHSTVQAIFRD